MTRFILFCLIGVVTACDDGSNATAESTDDGFEFELPALHINDALLGVWGNEENRLVFNADGSFEEVYTYTEGPSLASDDGTVSEPDSITETAFGNWSEEDGLLTLYYREEWGVERLTYPYYIHNDRLFVFEGVVFRTEGDMDAGDAVFESSWTEEDWEEANGEVLVDGETESIIITFSGDSYDLVESEVSWEIFNDVRTDMDPEEWIYSGTIRRDGDVIYIVDEDEEYALGTLLTNDVMVLDVNEDNDTTLGYLKQD